MDEHQEESAIVGSESITDAKHPAAMDEDQAGAAIQPNEANPEKQEWLPNSVALNLWVMSGFLLFKLLCFILSLLLSVAFAQFTSLLLEHIVSHDHALRASVTFTQFVSSLLAYPRWLILVFSAVWALLGVVLWRNSAQSRKTIKGLCNWLICSNSCTSPTADKDGTGMFATLAAFALAQGAAVTAVAKSEGRDAIVLSIYAVVVVFSYCWTRQMLWTRAAGRNYDQTTLEYGKYTLAWIVFIGSIMFTLGWYGLLPNQKSRILYNGLTIQCTPKRTNDSRFQAQNQWIQWIESQTSTFLHVEANSGFSANFETFDVCLRPPKDSTIDIRNAVAFVKHTDSSSATNYRQIGISDASGSWMITIVSPDIGDKVIVLCQCAVYTGTIEGLEFMLTPNFKAASQSSRP